MQTSPRLSRHELAKTLCVQHRWQMPEGRNRLAFAPRLLQDLGRLGLVSLPARQSPGRGPQKALRPGPCTANGINFLEQGGLRHVSLVLLADFRRGRWWPD